MRTNEKQIIKNIATIIYDKPEKINQLKKVGDICLALTSDYGVSVTVEVYKDYERYLINGTRCNMTITAKSYTHEMTRKHKNDKPIYSDTVYNMNLLDIYECIETRNK